VDDLRSPAGWLPVHRDQLWAQRSVSSMGSLYLLSLYVSSTLAHIYFIPGRGAKYCDERVCMSVCPYVCPVAYLKTTCPNFTMFSVHVNCGRGLVQIWRQCNMLCTSDFVDDVMFAHNLPRKLNAATTGRVSQSDSPGGSTGTNRVIYVIALFMDLGSDCEDLTTSLAIRLQCDEEKVTICLRVPHDGSTKFDTGILVVAGDNIRCSFFVR